jgi:hypothetical protein
MRDVGSNSNPFFWILHDVLAKTKNWPPPGPTHFYPNVKLRSITIFPRNVIKNFAQMVDNVVGIGYNRPISKSLVNKSKQSLWGG